MPHCSVDGCTNPFKQNHKGKPYCTKHYKQMYRHGEIRDDLIQQKKAWKHNVGDVVTATTGKRFEIIKCIRKDMSTPTKKRIEKGYVCLCYHCNEEFSPLETNVTKGQGCPYCHPSPQRIGASNCIATKAPHLVAYFKDPHMAQRVAPTSNIVIDGLCPRCLHEQPMYLPHLTKHGFRCEVCSDKISFGERVFASLMKALDIPYTPQYSKSKADWITDGTRYDFYLPTIDTIVEIHGVQHYGAGFAYLGGRTLEEEKENDAKKLTKAQQNGYELGVNYCVIDCSNSNIEWVSENILNSCLANKLDFSTINWEEVEKASLRITLDEVCREWNKYNPHEITPRELSRILGLSHPTVLKYLQLGHSLGLCSYTKESSRKGRKKREYPAQSVAMIAQSGEVVLEAKSVKDLVKQAELELSLKLNRGLVYQVCTGKRKKHQGYYFKYTNH